MSEFGIFAEDPYRGRPPTSHEQRSGESWDASYRDGPAPWQIGRPQPAVVRLAAAGGFVGTVLDAGCGSGENATYLASLGFSVLGFDVAETAVEIARAEADKQGVTVEFAVADALHLDRLGRTFDTVLDSALFHTFDEKERAEYAAGLAAVCRPDTTLYVMCFSDDGPDPGPHPVSRDELGAAFDSDSGWTITAIDSDLLQTRFHPDGAPAWLATIMRI